MFFKLVNACGHNRTATYWSIPDMGCKYIYMSIIMSTLLVNEYEYIAKTWV